MLVVIKSAENQIHGQHSPSSHPWQGNSWRGQPKETEKVRGVNGEKKKKRKFNFYLGECYSTVSRLNGMIPERYIREVSFCLIKVWVDTYHVLDNSSKISSRPNEIVSRSISLYILYFRRLGKVGWTLGLGFAAVPRYGPICPPSPLNHRCLGDTTSINKIRPLMTVLSNLIREPLPLTNNV